ncbi:hypothetical protein [Microvirga sp. BSC39]|jgi:hypothetical protein|uniref:hypothetical protein n=1 Tax=Microvirga sp. BSC39 TaxID=1549810 RepID=UPI000AF142F0|nr:hypothetical protein [Microvirga sp. BSC39]
MADRDLDLVKAALSELSRLKGAADDSTHILTRLYAAALEEWAGLLEMDPRQLSRMIP